MRIWSRALVTVAILTQTVGAQQPAAARDSGFDPAAYVLQTASIRMRDGVTLHVEILRPSEPAKPLPLLFSRTPYGVGGSTGRLTGSYRELAREGYIFVFQDIRGRYKSGGTFVMQRPPKPVDAPRSAIDEITDTNDSIDWLLANIAGNNGRVGMLGVSYDGWTSAMGMLGGHSALRAVSPQASPADM